MNPFNLSALQLCTHSSQTTTAFVQEIIFSVAYNVHGISAVVMLVLEKQ